MRKKKVGLGQITVVFTTVLLVGFVVWNLVVMYNIAKEQVEEIGGMRIQSIAAGFQRSLARAQSTFDRVSSDFEVLLSEGTTEEKIRLFLAEQREMEYALSEGGCLNVFCVVDGVVMISNMDTPEDYVLEERSWYRALMTKKKGEVYISPAYEDAWTDNMCITMARMLEDGSTVVGIDYNVSEIQSYVAVMSGDGYGDAIIVDEKETIVGYTDPDLIGRNLSEELPQYRDAFLQAAAVKADSFVLHNGMGIQSDTIFCSRTENGWYMMCSVSNWDLYRESYFQLFRNSVVVVLFVLAIVALYFAGRSGGQKDRDNERHARKKIEIKEREHRSYQIGITLVLVFTMVIVIVYTVNTAISESVSNMEEELQEYSNQVRDWVLEQKNILDRVDRTLTSNPEMLNDYDRTVQYLEDIGNYFPKMGLVFIANPDFTHGHFIVANNGWMPAEDYVVEERPWYIGALTSREFNISEPFYDVRTGEYCVTFSKVIESNKGEFYGVFGIHFYMNTLRDILDESHTDSGYAFLVNENGSMIGHVNPEYRVEYVLSHDESVNVHNLPYDRLYGKSGTVTLKDYDGEYRVCMSMDEEVSGFRIILVRNWWEIYGSAVQYAILFLLLLGGCILIVNWVISRMIHWQRNINEELRMTADSAIRAEQAKSRFLSNMSHEIRTPLNAILGMNEMILREGTNSQILTYAGNIESSGRILLTLINDILDMSKIESGKMEIIPIEYKMADLIVGLWNVIYLRAEEKGLALSFQLDETMPDTLYGDDVRVKQVVTNILTNAVKYTPEGSVELRASYEKQEDDMMTLIVSVRDTGIGIKEEDQSKLFENFQRLEENKNRNIEGTGLGMSITLMLLKLMGGDISVESVYQEGSTFTVRIPQKVISNEPVGDFESILKNQVPTGAKQYDRFEAPEANILVVDDNAMNLAVVTSLLKHTKMNIVTAESGMECLEIVKEQPFHIIFMDHMMPEMDGVQTLHEIQKMKDSPNEKTPVIALTANSITGIREYFLEEGFAEFFTKPINSAMLEQLIIDFLPEELVHLKKDDTDENGKENDITEENGEGNRPAAESGNAGYSRYQEYGISIEHGLSNASGNLELYLKIMEMFINDDEQQVRLKQFIENGDAHNYGIQVHALKGNARILGGDRLADMAYEHEKESKAGNLAYVEEHWEELVECWDRTQAGFKEYYRESVGEQAEVPATAVSLSDADIFQITPEEIAEVVSFLDAYETPKAVERMKEWLKKSLEPERRSLIENALAAIEKEYDEDKAIEILTHN